MHTKIWINTRHNLYIKEQHCRDCGSWMRIGIREKQERVIGCFPKKIDRREPFYKSFIDVSKQLKWDKVRHSCKDSKEENSAK